jgi:hypothetical protein
MLQNYFTPSIADCEVFFSSGALDFAFDTLKQRRQERFG